MKLFVCALACALIAAPLQVACAEDGSGAAQPSRADCDAGAISSSVLFETDRRPLPDDELFSGERGVDSRRHAIVTTGVLSSPVARRTETLCSSREAFLSAIRQRFDAKRGRQVLIYIHGYDNSFDSAAENALTLQAALHFPGPVIVYSWPAKVTSALTYVNDESNAEWSMSHFADLLDLLKTEFPRMPISFAGHSLGSRFVTNGIRLLRFSKCANCFGRAALFAADVDSDTLYGELHSMGACDAPPLEAASSRRRRSCSTSRTGIARCISPSRSTGISAAAKPAAR